ncbi:MAG: MFS transporter [Acidimicrobiales bacterium]
MRDIIKDPAVAYRRRWGTLLVLCLSLMVIGLDNTILNVAIPTLSRSLHASTSQLQWIVDSYTIVFAGLLLTAGSLGDRFGRYRALAIGLAIFGVGSLASAFATSATTLIATRAFMGIGGAFIMPATLSIITNVFTDPAERGKAIGIWAGVSALGIGFGPLVGGYLLTQFWWGSVFLVNVPVVMLALVAGFMLVPDSRDPSAPKLDPVGAVLSIAGLGAILYAIIEGPSYGWTSLNVLGGFGLGVVVLGGFMAWELSYSSPMLDIRFFHNPRFTAASGAITLTFFTLFGSLFLLTQYLQSVLGYSTLRAGAVLLPQAVLLMACASTSNLWVRRFGNKIVVAFGLSVVAVALVLFALLPVDASMTQVIIATLVLGLGMGNVMAPATDSIMGSLPRAKAGVGSAVNDTTRQVGGAVGVAALGSILSSGYHHSVSAGAVAQHFPLALSKAISDNVGRAVGIAHSPQAGEFGPAISDLARRGFVSAFHTADVVGAGIMVLAALCVAIWLPARARDETGPAPEGRFNPADAPFEELGIRMPALESR